MDMELDHDLHSDDDEIIDNLSDESEEEDQEPWNAHRMGVNPNRLPLHHFLRLIGGGAAMAERVAANSNDELVQHLRRTGVLNSQSVIKALQACPRDVFVPGRHADEAFIDAPIRLDAAQFNISAPHMHASCLEALQLQPGHRFLDVGSGCGILVAAGAYLVGKTGLSVGIDIKKAAIKMGNANLKALQENNQEFASVAAPWKLELRNVFLPSRKHMGQYDRVHVGAACPPDRLSSLLPLLRPTGGSIVTPVSPSDLRLITKDAQGNVTQQVLSQVRYSDLEVPSDAEIVLATLKMERKERTAVPLPPSTFQQDVCSITGSPSSSNASDTSTFTMDRLHSRDSMQLGLEDSYCASPAEAGAKATWSRRMAKLLTSCGSSSSGDSSKDSGMLEVDKSPRRVSLDCSSLGEPDTVLVGADFRIPVHRVVLRTRCDHFKALCSSGMRDADDTEPQVPEHFGKEAVITFVQYLYHDVLDARTDPEHAIAVLHVAHYYGAARLVGLCELVLARELKKCEAGDAETNEAAAALLALSDETGLTHLRSVCLDYIVNHYAAVRAAKAWATLSRSQVDLVADEACRVAARTQELLRSVARTSPMPDRFVR